MRPSERPWRAEVCLNGLWQFQPVPVPRDYRRDQGQPPELPRPRIDGWETTPIRIPSPWNVNRWGPGRRGREVGEGTPRPFYPDSDYYPGYPRSWDDAQMGWLRRTFQVPADWREQRVLLHFEAVAGQFQVFINGTPAGEHFDSHLPAVFDITTLVRRDTVNELLVGVRHAHLFNRKSARYAKFSAPYPPGSNTDPLVGIWQDVFLLAVPAVRVEDVFIQPAVDQDRLNVVATVRNDSAQAQSVQLGGQVQPWLNLAGSDRLAAPEPKWSLGEPVLALPVQTARLDPGASTNFVLAAQPSGRLKTWSPGAPHLYALTLALRGHGSVLDTRCERFGWRQLTLHGREVRLNGEAVRMFGDFSHPFGPFMMSRRFAWAWCRMIKDCGGNALRPHAQPYPRHYLEVADEMGVLVLDETAVFGSSIRLNPEDPAFWTRYTSHFEQLIRRDRNHPSVFGWSFGNEMFAIPALNKMSPADTADYYSRLTGIGLRAQEWDPTRAWISCDGDDDLGGKLPVWSKHYGHNLPSLPDVPKPQMVGESGGTYYARPAQLAVFNGDRAYESCLGRNEALAIDLYQNLVQLALPKLAYFSPSEMIWFGLEHLPLGRSDFSRLPTLDEGVFFGPFVEGQPGMQPERLPPYCGTLNPGWDPALPLYQPLPMFHAMKAALAKGGSQPCAWDHRPPPDPRPAQSVRATTEHATLVGSRSGALGQRLAAWGVPVPGAGPPVNRPDFIIVDADTLTESDLPQVRQSLEEVRTSGGTALVMAGASQDQPGLLKAVLPSPVRFTERPATALVPDREHPWTAPLTLAQLYFAEDGVDRFIARQGMEGTFVEQGRVLLRASNTDWSLFNNAPEEAKAGAVVLYEQLIKPSGAVLVEHPHGRGKILLCTLDYRVASGAADNLWRKLFANMGFVLGAARQGTTAAFSEDGTLVNALSIGRFGAASLDEVLSTDFLGPAATSPQVGTAAGGRAWAPVASPSKDRFIFHQMKQDGPQEAFAVYFSCWIKSPRSLDDLLQDGPDAPRLTALCYVSKKCRLFVNGHELASGRTEPADYRTLQVFEGMALKKGWNHLLIKVASSRLLDPQPGTLAVRLHSNNPDYFRQLESATELPSSALHR